MQSLTIIKPDDWHLHLRDGEYLKRTVPDSAHCFGRAIVMPNLKPPVSTLEAIESYQQRILEMIPKNSHFHPLMTLYLTDQTTSTLIKAAKKTGVIACKYYPAGATTNSALGVTRLDNIYPALEAMAECNMPLLIHGEVVDSTTDVFDREKKFIYTILEQLVTRFSKLKIVLEHITTKHAVEFIMKAPKTVAATITVHHLLLNRNDMLIGGIKPHYYCLPILKAKKHQQALIKAAISGNRKFFLGTDSAPHPKQQKESACGCAGIYSAHAAIELYAEIFEHNNALDKLEQFASKNGADFYGLPYNKETITLIKKSWQVPEILGFGKDQLVPLKAGETLQWLVEKNHVK